MPLARAFATVVPAQAGTQCPRAITSAADRLHPYGYRPPDPYRPSPSARLSPSISSIRDRQRDSFLA